MLTFGPLPLFGLSLVLLAALLLVCALLPSRSVASVRLRERLVLSAIGILVPIAVGSLVVGLS